MGDPAFRTKILGRVALAHILGLWAAGIMGTIQSDAGLDLGEGAFIGIFLGGLLSVPWLLGLAAIIWFYSDRLERHPILFALLGPLVVCGTWAVTFGAMLEAVALSTAVSSACYLVLVFSARWSRAETVTDS